MNYQSYEDMADVIRRNLWKIPADIDIVVGVPRSGLIAALMIAELLNKPCGFICGTGQILTMSGGVRESYNTMEIPVKILVIEDVVNTGYSINKIKAALAGHHKDWEFIYAAIYVEGKDAKSLVDIYLQDNYIPDDSDWFYEWNILHHSKSDRHLWDIDGLLCKNPPDDHDTAAYEAYISNPLPMVIPTYPVGGFVTYRLEKYRALTQNWLKRQGIKYQQLVMFPADDRETRNAQMSPAIFKANIYRSLPQFKLFVESDASQAELICAASGKPVYCYENGKLYK
jgi:uncharacterized HAD superfamily protein/adenine/guanine phosphoribosyltransferase-like PRPP-binding protein